MRFRIPTRRAVLFAALFALALLASLPMRLVLGWAGAGISAREASGTAWSGSLKEARAGAAILGDLDARLAPLPLLLGRARLEIERSSAAPDRLSGALVVSRNMRATESLTGMVPIDAQLAGLPVESLSLNDMTVRFRDGQCDRAEGMVTASLSGSTLGAASPASVSGSVRCDRGDLLIPLAGGAGSGVALRVAGNGRYRPDATPTLP
jgi:general secretion pathway protein N